MVVWDGSIVEMIMTIEFFEIKCDGVMPDSHSGNKSDIFHHSNKNNQLKRQVWPPKETIRCPDVDLSILLE